MKTLGSMVSTLLPGMILGTFMALFTVLPIDPPKNSTLGEKTSGQKGNREVTVVLESGEELQLRVTGSRITEVRQN